MGEKVTFNEITKIIEIDEAPDGNGDINLDVKVDLYSDGKEDWVANENLRKFQFPIRVTGGDLLPGAKALGGAFFLKNDWYIRPYNADHRLLVSGGDLYHDDGTDFYLNTVGAYTVRIIQEVSALIFTITADAGDVADSVWSHSTAVALDLNVKRILGLTQENFVIDNQVYQDYNGAKLLTSARIRTYVDEAKSAVLATYQITATWNSGENILYQVLRVI